MNILCLEQGGWMKPSDYPTNYPDYEARGFGDFAMSPNTRKRPADYPINASGSPIDPVMFNAVGGSTILWAAHFPRLDPDDFRVRSSDGVADDWPLGFDTLAPFFDLNDRMMGVSGLAGDPLEPPRKIPLPPLPLGTVGNALARGFNSLGWHWWPSPAAITSREYEGRAPCINLSPCITGCAQGAKASTDITYWPAAQRRGVQVRTDCRVREVSLRPDGMAGGVLYYDAEGNLHEQKAEIVVLACNGIGTPRLLLNSTSSRFPDGLCNRSGQVGSCEGMSRETYRASLNRWVEAAHDKSLAKQRDERPSPSRRRRSSLGVEKVITAAFDTWPKQPVRSERPYVFGTPNACRSHTIAAIAVGQAHGELSERYRAGDRSVTFPPGTYPPPLLQAA